MEDPFFAVFVIDFGRFEGGVFMAGIWNWLEMMLLAAFHWDNLFAAIRGEGAMMRR